MRARLVPFAAITVAVVAGLAGPAAAQSKGDKAILKAGVITRADVPAGWMSTKAANNDSALKGISECRALRSAMDRAKKKVPHADSRDFEDPAAGSLTSASGIVYAFKDAAAAGRFLANFQGDGAQTCLTKNLAKQTARERTTGAPAVTPITDLEGVGDEAVGHELTQDSTAYSPSTLYIDLVFVRVGRAFVGFQFTNLGERIPYSPAIIQTLAARLDAAQSA
jgi:hypothetical protein